MGFEIQPEVFDRHAALATQVMSSRSGDMLSSFGVSNSQKGVADRYACISSILQNERFQNGFWGFATHAYASHMSGNAVIMCW